MASRMERSLDATDWHILRELQGDARLSYHELGRRVGLSAPAVAERARRLEEAGIVTGYHAHVDPAKIGLAFSAFIQMRCVLGKCLLKTTQPEDYPEVMEIHKLSGDYCAMLRVRAASIQHLEALIERLGQHGEMRTSIVLSSPLEGRAIAAEQMGADTDADRAQVWGR